LSYIAHNFAFSSIHVNDMGQFLSKNLEKVLIIPVISPTNNQLKLN